MLAAQRRGRILAELSRDGTVRVTDLEELLGVSDMTVRRDLVALHRDGLLEKVHGGALAVAEPSSSEPGFAVKSVQRRREKEAIAAAAPGVPPQAIGVVAAGAMWELAAATPGVVILESWWFRPRDLAFVVDDLAGEHARLTDAGFAPRKLVDFAPGGEVIARFFFIADPDGYQIEVLQRQGRYR